MHSMMVLKKFDDNLHLKFNKDVMMSSQMLYAPSKPNPLQKTQMVLEFYF
jgi:regulatory protein YycH of two-component signal transduction system YycFG